MKKLLAIVLALMLLTASVAIAENANLTKFSNIKLDITTAEGSQSVDLDGMTAVLAIGAPNDKATIQLDVDADGEKLMTAVMQILDGMVLMNIEGMERPIGSAFDTSTMATTGEDPMAALTELFANYSQYADMKMPVFEGATIPKVDLFGLVDQLSTLGVNLPVETDANGAKTASFSIPYEAVNQVLNMLPMFIPEENQAQLAPVMDQIKAMTANGGGIALEGKLSDDGTTAELLIDVLPVSGGVAGAAVGGLYFSSVENEDTLEVLMYQEGQSIALVSFDLQSDPEAATLYLTADIMGTASFSFGMYPDTEIEGAQVVAFEMNAEGQSFTTSIVYGEIDETEFVDFAMEVPEQIAMNAHIEETPDGNGGKTGALDIVSESNGQVVEITADIEVSDGEFTFSDIENTANPYNAQAMSEAEQQAFQEDLSNAIMPLMNYFMTIQPAA